MCVVVFGAVCIGLAVGGRAFASLNGLMSPAESAADFIEAYRSACADLHGESQTQHQAVYAELYDRALLVLGHSVGTPEEREVRMIVLALANVTGRYNESERQLVTLRESSAGRKERFEWSAQLALVLQNQGVSDVRKLHEALVALDETVALFDASTGDDWLQAVGGDPFFVLPVFSRRAEILQRLDRNVEAAQAYRRLGQMTEQLPADMQRRYVTTGPSEAYARQAAALLKAGDTIAAHDVLAAVDDLPIKRKPANFHALVISNIPMSGAYRGFVWRWLNEQPWDQYTPQLVLVYAIMPAIDGHDDTANPVEWRRRSIELLNRLLTENNALITAADASDDVNGMARAARAQGREPTALEREPGRAQVHATLMDLFWADGRITGALQHARILVDRYPMHATAASASKLINDNPQTQ